MTRIRFRSVLPAAVLLVAALGSCSKDPAPPAAPPSPLPSLVSQADLTAGRAEAILNRAWITRLEFRQRLFARVQSLRSFSQEAAAATNDPAVAQPGLVERGRAFVDQSGAMDDALALLEQVANTLDQLVGYERGIELNMAPLETRGEAPYRIRVTDYGKQVALGFRHLDLALQGTAEKSADAKLHQNIAVKALSDALATATKLFEDVKKTGHLSSAATDRQKLLRARIAWADSIKAKAPDKVPPDASGALEEARKLAQGDLESETGRVIESLRNSQPDAPAKATALAERVDVHIERVTRAFLQIGREAGVPDPK